MNWNEPISVPEETERKPFFVFDDGDEVNFEIIGFEKAVSSNNNPMAKLELMLSDDEGHSCKAFENLVLCEKMAWRLKEFMVAIGQAEPTAKLLNPNWLKVFGSTGKCKVEVEAYGANKEKRINKVAKWLAPGAAPEAKTEPEAKFDF